MMENMEAFYIQNGEQAVFIFYRHISRIVCTPDAITIITDDGGSTNLTGEAIPNALKVIEAASPFMAAQINRYRFK